MSSSKPPLVLIAGPTASSKSALAFALAQQINGVIVNADSAQIYCDLRVLSAAPTDEQRKKAEHRLYSVMDGALACSANDWAIMATREIADVHQKSRTPIVVGGTGLYIKTLLEGIAPIPEIDLDVRARVRAGSVEANFRTLRTLDAESARRVHPADTTRISRALEVILSTGRSLSDWRKERRGGIAERVELRPLVLQPPRNWLYERCNDRFAKMIVEGALTEVEVLLERKLDTNLPVMRAIGVHDLSNYLLGHCTLDEAIAAACQATRRYAKRQYTWFAHQSPPHWPRLSEALTLERIEAALALVAPKD